ncbi:hypothetical protein [Streptomyces phaeochromogenes]
MRFSGNVDPVARARKIRRLLVVATATASIFAGVVTVPASAEDDVDWVDSTTDATHTESESDDGLGFGSSVVDGPFSEFEPTGLPGGAWPEQRASAVGATVRFDGRYRGVVEDRNRGTRQEAELKLMEPGGNPEKERGVYGRADWYASKERCYLTSLSSSGCSTAWVKVDDTETGRENSNTTWQYWDVWDNVEPTYNSGRGALKGCIDIKRAKDKCTAAIIRGSSY